MTQTPHFLITEGRISQGPLHRCRERTHLTSSHAGPSPLRCTQFCRIRRQGMDHSLWTPRLLPNTVLYLRLQSMESYCIFFVVFCVFPFWSLSHPLIFLVYPHAHPQKTRHECSLGSCRAGQGWGLSRVLDQVRYQERSLDGVVSCG